MADITALILEDHSWFRQQFLELDGLRAQDGVDVAQLRRIWDPLSRRLDLHAIAEEEIFYPQLLAQGEDPEAETLDAIGDHNDIRDGLHGAARQVVGTTLWWNAVGRAREANDEHMAEEEREGLADFRAHAPAGLRESLGRQFAAFLDTHRTTRGVDTSDKDPAAYVREIEHELHPHSDDSPIGDGSLGIGSLKGR
jgi:hypothetical protein